MKNLFCLGSNLYQMKKEKPIRSSCTSILNDEEHIHKNVRLKVSAYLSIMILIINLCLCIFFCDHLCYENVPFTICFGFISSYILIYSLFTKVIKTEQYGSFDFKTKPIRFLVSLFIFVFISVAFQSCIWIS